MSDIAKTLSEAYAALQAIGPPVRLVEDEDPNTDEVIVLIDVSDTALPHYGIRSTRKLIQVSCYSTTKLKALTLDTKARTALRRVGFAFIQSRPTFADDHIGQISDYRR